MSFTLTMPKLSPTMEEGTLVKWHKKEGDFVQAGDVVFEIATDKATVEHTALDAGYLRKIMIKEGEKAKVNDVVAYLTESANSPFEMEKPIRAVQEAPKIVEKPVTAPPQVEKRERLFISPLARKIAQERGLNIDEIRGTGPRGRIVSSDLPATTPQPTTTRAIPTPALMPGEEFQEVPFTPMRKTIADRLSYSKAHIPHFYLSIEANVTKLVQIRTELKSLESSYTVNDFIIKACAQALEKHPQVCSSFDEEKEVVRLHKSVDISVAVTVQNGLITPILRRANTKSLRALSIEIKELAARAKDGKLRPEEYTGGGFTLSNLGMFGIDDFQAIINPPQCAILSVGAIVKKPAVINDAIIPQDMMHVTLSCDHRVIDGVTGAEFMKSLRKLLENPLLLY